MDPVAKMKGREGKKRNKEKEERLKKRKGKDERKCVYTCPCVCKGAQGGRKGI